MRNRSAEFAIGIFPPQAESKVLVLLLAALVYIGRGGGRRGVETESSVSGLPKFPAGFLRPVTEKRKIPAARHQPRMIFVGGSQFSLPDAGH